VSAPRISGEGAAAQAAAADQPRLLLTVAISRKGFYVAGAGGVLGADAPGVDQTRPPTVPLRPDGRHDFEALTAQMQRVKERYPKETNVIFSADGDVPYEVLVQTMDAVREVKVKAADGSVERRPLFFDVSLSLVG
jgi:biopolymer transport protein ExbD